MTAVGGILQTESETGCRYELQCMYTVNMSRLRFVWDAKKSAANRKKHGVSFEEAQTVFFDENAIEFFDPHHSEDEDWFLLLGLGFRHRVLVVCHCHRESEGIIRIISARRATRKERAHYTEAKP